MGNQPEQVAADVVVEPGVALADGDLEDRVGGQNMLLVHDGHARVEGRVDAERALQLEDAEARVGGAQGALELSDFGLGHGLGLVVELVAQVAAALGRQLLHVAEFERVEQLRRVQQRREPECAAPGLLEQFLDVVPTLHDVQQLHLEVEFVREFEPFEFVRCDLGLDQFDDFLRVGFHLNLFLVGDLSE